MNKYRLLLVKEGVYVGEFKDGKCDGQGILTSQSSIYEGEWKDNNVHGRGKLIIGDDVQDGFWHMGDYECEWKISSFRSNTSTKSWNRKT